MPTLLYKLVAAVSATRSRLVLAQLISEEQSAFVEGKGIVDSVLLAREDMASYQM